jgi:hypothetical protein
MASLSDGRISQPKRLSLLYGQQDAGYDEELVDLYRKSLNFNDIYIIPEQGHNIDKSVLNTILIDIGICK